MRPGGAVLLVAVALVRHEVVQGVGPDGDAGERGHDGGVVGEELVRHHLELRERERERERETLSGLVTSTYSHVE